MPHNITLYLKSGFDSTCPQSFQRLCVAHHTIVLVLILTLCERMNVFSQLRTRAGVREDDDVTMIR